MKPVYVSGMKYMYVSGILKWSLCMCLEYLNEAYVCVWNT